MFTYYYVLIERSLDDVEERFNSFFGRFNSWAEAAYREGEDLRASISVGLGSASVAKAVRMQVGDPVRADKESIVPIVWEATGPTALFPTMTGKLILAAVGPDLTQLAFRGDYDPPLGAIGRVLDKVLMHRLAESSVKGFVDRVADALNDA